MLKKYYEPIKINPLKSYWIYILASKRNGTLYIGVTNNLCRRIYEHKEQLFKGFTKKNGVNQLVYIEEFNRIEEAIYREKTIKNWKREWKLRLIESANPAWKDLSDDLM